MLSGILLSSMDKGFVHDDHKHQYEQKKAGIEAEAYMASQKTEKGWGKAASNIGAGHLHADDSLGLFCTEMLRGGVYYAGIYGSTAEAQKYKS